MAGATVIESPVCTPIGSRFSIEQTTTTLSCLSRISSSSYSFQPEDRLLEQHLGGRAGLQPAAGDPVQLGLVVGDAGAAAAHRERRAHDDRVAERRRPRRAPRPSCGRRRCARDSAADRPRRSSLNSCRSSPRWIASTSAPISSTPYCSSTPLSCSAIAAFSAVCPPRVGSSASGRSFSMIFVDELGRDRLDVGGVGELRVGHDRRRVGVDEDDPQALVLEHPAGLRAGVVELRGLADDDRAGADHQDVLQVARACGISLASIRVAKRSNR